MYVLEDNTVTDTLPGDGDGTTWKGRLCTHGGRLFYGTGRGSRSPVYVVPPNNDAASTPTHPKPISLIKAPRDGVGEEECVTVDVCLGATLAKCDWFGGPCSRALCRELQKLLDPAVPLWEQGVLPGATLYLLGGADVSPIWSVRMLTGRTLLLPVLRPTVDTVNDMMCRLQDCEGIPPDQQRIIEGDPGRQLDPTLLLKDRPTLLVDHVAMYLVLRLRGGGGGGAFFSALCKVTAVPFDSTAPKWRKAGAGLNLEARCPNTECAAHKSKGTVIVHVGYVHDLDVVALKHGKLGAAAPALVCRGCHCAIPPNAVTTCGFVDCDWSADGFLPGSERKVRKSGTASASEYTRAEDGDEHVVCWMYLRISATPPCAVGRLEDD